MGAPIAPTWTANYYLFYQSNGTTQVGTENTQTTLDTDTVYYCVMSVFDTTANKTNAVTIQWQYNLAGGGWNTVTTTTPVKFANGSLTDGDTTQTAKTSETGTFQGSRVYESANTSAVVWSTPGNEADNFGEHWLGFTIDSAQVSDGQEVLLRATLGDGTAFDVENVQADIDINVPAVIYDGTASFTGAGTLAATGQHIRIYDGTASFTGAGSLVGTGAYVPGTTVYPGTASFTGAGSLSATGAWTSVATASFTGAGTFSGTGSHRYAGNASFTGAGSVTADGQGQYQALASFTGAGTFSGVGQLIGTFPGTADFTGAGTFSAVGATTYGGTASFTGSGSVSANGQGLYQALASFTGAGSLSAVGQQKGTIPATASFTGGSSFTADGQGQYQATADFTGAGSLSATGTQRGIFAGTASFTGSGSLSATGEGLTILGYLNLYVNELWQLYGLDHSEPVNITKNTVSAGNFTITYTGNDNQKVLTRTGSVVYPDNTLTELVEKIRQVWKFAGLDPDDPFTNGRNSQFTSDIQVTLTGNGETSTIMTRSDQVDYLDINAGGDDLLINATDKLRINNYG